MIRNRLWLTLALLFLLSLVPRARAATRTWTGNGGDGLWSTGGNWSGGIAPGSIDTAVFPAGLGTGITLDTNATSIVRAITFQGSGYTIVGNDLEVTQAITQTATSGTNTLEFLLTFGANHTVSCASGSTLLFTSPASLVGNTVTFDGAGTIRLQAVVSGTGGIIKNGTGTLYIEAMNTYSGPTTMNGGTVIVSPAGRLGGALSVTDTRLELNTNVTATSLSLNGAYVLGIGVGRKLMLPATVSASSTGNGPATVENLEVVLAGGGTAFNVPEGLRYDDLVIAGAVTGGGGTAFTKGGNGRLALLDYPTSNSAFTGTIAMQAGQLSIRDVNAAGDSAGGILLTGGVLEISADLYDAITVNGGSIEVSGARQLTGGMTLQSSLPLTILPASSFTIAGNITGLNQVVPTMAADSGLTFLGAGSFAGPLTIADGSLAIHGNQPTVSVVMNGGTIMGAGSSGAVSLNAGSFQSSGMTTEGLTIAGGDYRLTNDANGFVKTTVNGDVALGGNLVFYGNLMFVPQVGQPLMLIDKTTGGAVTGAFLGLPEGAQLQAGAYTFAISYLGGDGNDVTLTRVALPGTIALLTMNATVTEGAGAKATLEVMRTGGTDGTVSVQYATVDGTATTNDYGAVTGTLTWADGDASNRTIEILITDDSLYELQEQFTLVLSNPAGGASLGASTANVFIDPDGDAGTAGTIELSSATYSVLESAGSVTLTLTRSGGSDGAVSVTPQTANGTAVVGDYASTNGVTVDWQHGDAAPKSFTIPILNDTDIEPNETFTVSLTNPSGGAVIGATGTSTITILNDDINAGKLRFAGSNPQIGENAGTVTLAVERVSGSEGPASVSFATSNETANAGTDYTAASGTLSWGDGEAGTKTISVSIIDDAVMEADETFRVTLANPTGAQLDTSVQDYRVVTIGNDDVPGSVQLSAANYTAFETAGEVVITLTRTGGSAGPASVQVVTAPDSASEGSDYQPVTTTVSWADGDATAKTVTVQIVNDTTVENDETFFIRLSNVTSAAGGNPQEALVTVKSDDQPSPGVVQFQSATYSMTEGAGLVTVTLTRTGGDAGAVTVTFFPVAGGTATKDVDYGDPTGGSTAWADGNSAPLTYQFAVNDDTLFEPNETFIIGMAVQSGAATVGANDTTTITIVNDDAEPAGSLGFTASQFSAGEGAGTIAFSVERTGGTNGPVSVDYATSDGNAVAPDDYTQKSGTLTWANGEGGVKTFTVPIIDDTDVEGLQSFNVTLSNFVAADMALRALAQGVIQDNDVAPAGQLSLSAATATIAESGGAVQVTVLRTGGSNGPATVQYITSNNGASAGSDYQSASGTLSWADGDANPKTISVIVTNDTVAEGPENFSIVISNPTGASLGATNETLVTIVDDDSAGEIVLGSASYSVAEAAGTLTVTLLRTGGSSGAATAQISAAGISASAGTDFAATPATLSWADGDSSTKSWNIAITNDTAPESAEEFTVQLSNPTGATLGTPASATVTINDDDIAQPGEFVLSAASYTVSEGAASIAVVVKRINGSDGAMQVSYLTMNNGTATAGADYQSRTGTLTWQDGDATDRTVIVPILDDSSVESPETFAFALTGAVGGAGIGNPATATITITDDDQAGVLQFSSATYGVGEDGGSAVISVTRTNGSAGPASVSFSTANGTASAPADYAQTSGTLTWAAGEAVTKTFAVAIADDSAIEGGETFSVTLANPTGAALGNVVAATVTINDNDVPSAGTLQFSAANATVSEGAGSITITVTRTGGTAGPASVSYTTASGSALSGSDFNPATGTLSWPDGDATPKNFNVTINEDQLLEGAENFSVALTNATGATAGAPATITVTISDNEVAPAGSLQFTQGSVSHSEGVATLTLSVTRSGGSNGQATVQYATSAGTATSGVDYAQTLGSLTWADGDSSAKSIQVPVTDDAVVEGAETFSIALSNATGATLGAPSVVVVTIADNDVAPAGTLQFSSAAYSVAESGGTVSVTVTRAAGSNGPATIQYSTASGSATAGADFTAASGTLTWADGDAAGKTFTIAVADDSTVEGAETFNVSLANATGATLGAPLAAIVTINDDDVAPAGTLQWSAASYAVSEGAGSVTVTVTRGGGSNGTATVQYNTANGSATAPADYSNTGGQVQWADGDASARTFTVAIVDDAVSEASETFSLTLSNATGATLGSPSAAAVTITDDDLSPAGSVQFAGASQSVSEKAGVVTIPVTRAGGSNGAGSVQYTLVAGTATAGSDFATSSGVLSWTDGDSASKTIAVSILDDSVAESAEQFTVVLSSASGVTLGTPATFTVSITDDDAAPQASLQFLSATTAVREDGGHVTLRVARTNATQGVASVRYATADRSATSPADFTAVSGVLTWADGEAGVKVITVPIINDTQREGGESFLVSLSNPTGASLASPSTAVVQIEDDEPTSFGAIRFSQANYTATESDGGVVLSVVREGDVSQNASVSFATVNGSATAAIDYESVAGSVSFAAGEAGPKEIAIEVHRDQLEESDETFTVIFTDVNGATTGSPSVATVTITDSRPEMFVFPIVGSANGTFGSVFRTALQLHNPTDAPMTGLLRFMSPDGTPAGAMPYTLAPRSVLSYGDLLGSFTPPLSGLGSLSVDPATLGAPPVTTLRIYNDAGSAGTTGVAEELVTARDVLSAGDRGILIAPSDALAMRFNIGVRAVADATVRITLRSQEGDLLRQSEQGFARGSFRQVAASSLVGMPVVGNETIHFEVITGSVVIYGAATDNTTQDPSIAYARPLPPFSAAPGVAAIPVVGSAQGAFGSFFRTTLQLHNPYDSTLRVLLRFRPQGATNGDRVFELTLPKLATRAYADIVPVLSASGVGTLTIESSASMPVVAARVFNDGGALGTAGMTEPALARENALRSGERGVLVAPMRASAARFNIGVRTFEASSMRVECRDANGAMFASSSRSYPGDYLEQVTAASFCGDLVPDDASVEVRMTSGAAVVYGASTDNRTQDPWFQVAQRR